MESACARQCRVETRGVGCGRTVRDVAVFDLLQHLGPHGGVALLVCVDAFGAQVQPLADAAGALIRGRLVRGGHVQLVSQSRGGDRGTVYEERSSRIGKVPAERCLVG
jgi:hypothetical protein